MDARGALPSIVSNTFCVLGARRSHIQTPSSPKEHSLHSSTTAASNCNPKPGSRLIISSLWLSCKFLNFAARSRTHTHTHTHLLWEACTRNIFHVLIMKNFSFCSKSTTISFLMFLHILLFNYKEEYLWSNTNPFDHQSIIVSFNNEGKTFPNWATCINLTINSS